MRLLAILLLLAASAVHADTDFTVIGSIDLAADGTVKEVRIGDGLPQVVADAVTRAVRSWRFAPLDDDVRAGMHLSLNARDADGDLVLEVLDASFGASPVHAVPPRYPHRALNLGVSAEVAMRMLIGDDGEVVEVHARRVDLTAPRMRDADLAHLRTQFARAAADATSRWRFDPVAAPQGSSIDYTIEFKLTADSVAGGGRNHSLHRGEPRPAPWEADGRAPLVAGTVRILENVVGSIL